MPIRQAIVAAAIGLACTTPCSSQPDAGGPSNHLREAALDSLLSERGPIDRLKRLITEARQAGVSEQAILEARFLYHVDHLDDAAIAAMLPDFLARQEKFTIEDSAIFAVKDDWLAVTEYVKAIAALQTGDKEGFKRHITEAFWLGPRQAAAFAPHIERLRHEEAMQAITLDFNTRVSPLGGGTTISLQSLVDDRKALLIHFWSPLSRECEMSLPDFARTSAMLQTHRVAVLSLCPEDIPQAAEISRPHRDKSQDTWAVDSDSRPLGTLLQVRNLPTMTLVDPSGKILFSGDPTDQQFWDTLTRIDPSITRPEVHGDYGQ